MLSTGFCVSVGWPVTSPGRDDMPGSLLVPLLSSVVLGVEGRATLPAVSLELGELTPPRVSVVGAGLVPTAPPLFAAPVSVPDVVGLLGEAGVVGLVLLSSAGGVSEGEVRVRCMAPAPPRPCDLLRLFFLIFLSGDELGTDSVELPAAALPLTAPELSLPTPVLVEAAPPLGAALEDVSRFELLSGCDCPDFALVSEDGAEFVAGLLLGSEVFVLEVFEDWPGRALLFWSAGSVAEPLSSVVWLFEVVVVLVLSLVPVPVDVWARAPNALSARANAAMAMSFKVGLLGCSGDGGDSRSGILPTRAREPEARRGRGLLATSLSVRGLH